MAMAMAMSAMSSTYGTPDMFDVKPCHKEDKKRFRSFRKQRDDETDEEYAAAWHEHRKQRLADDCAKKGLTVFEINGELIPAKNEREAHKRYNHRHK